ncbi:MAG: OadG family transporter subunit [Gammaproteobacteria bacterium]|nr:OadG family transporter subunit [Gammaproteobacteria bacterium]
MDELQPLIIASAQLMLIGMGTVFIILTMLIFLIGLVSKLLPAEEYQPVTTRTPVSTAASTTAATEQDAELVAVISAAIKLYKKRHKSF